MEKEDFLPGEFHNELEEFLSKWIKSRSSQVIVTGLATIIYAYLRSHEEYKFIVPSGVVLD